MFNRGERPAKPLPLATLEFWDLKNAAQIAEFFQIDCTVTFLAALEEAIAHIQQEAEDKKEGFRPEFIAFAVFVYLLEWGNIITDPEENRAINSDDFLRRKERFIQALRATQSSLANQQN